MFTATATPGTPVSVTAVAGSSQTGTVGTPVPVAPSVVVRDNRGNPVSGITVSFVIGSGNGTVVGSTVVTNASGTATVSSWTLGGTAGTQTLIARVTNLPDVVFSATATAGAASVVQALSSQNLGNLTVATNQAASSLPSIRVTDASGNPIQGVQVTFALGNANSGTISGEVQTTNASGVATLGSWTSHGGRYRLGGGAGPESDRRDLHGHDDPGGGLEDRHCQQPTDERDGCEQ